MWSSLSDSDCVSFRSQADDTTATAQSSSRVRSRYVGFSSFMVGAGRRRKRPRTGQKYNFLPNAGFLFNLSYLFDAAKTYHASQTETKRRSGFRFGFQSEKSPFHGSRYKKSPTYGTERAKKKNPRRQNRRRFGRKSAGGRHGTGCVPSRNSQAMSVESYPSFITSSMPISL